MSQVNHSKSDVMPTEEIWHLCTITLFLERFNHFRVITQPVGASVQQKPPNLFVGSVTPLALVIYTCDVIAIEDLKIKNMVKNRHAHHQRAGASHRG